MAQLFEATRPLVLNDDDWDPLVVLPTLQMHLQLGAHAMGQMMTALLEQYGHVGEKRKTRDVYLTLSAIAAVTKGSSGGSGTCKARCSAGRGAR